jgi:glycosyltransferase involved in cell wall biosynthesis
MPIFKLFCRKKVIVNIDGLEHRRAKWKNWVRKYLKQSEKMAVKFANVIIADNKGIQQYVKEVYNKDAEMITYGGDHALVDVSPEREKEILQKYGLTKNGYAISVCRIEPENNCHITLEAYSQSDKQLVFIGNWQRNGYSIKLKEEYTGKNNIKLLDSIYDLEELYTLRKNAEYYIHGHSAGGTNPSLVEAMHFGRPILAFDVVYNRETTKGKAAYFTDANDLLQLISKNVDNGKVLKEIACEEYTWAKIAKEYEALY